MRPSCIILAHAPAFVECQSSHFGCVKRARSWTLDNPLGPQAGATGWETVPQAVFRVGVQHFAPAAKSTGRKCKTLHAVAIGDIIRVIPEFQQTGLGHIAHDMPQNCPLAMAQKASMLVKQGRARADAPIPANRHRPALDERANVVRAA